MALYEGLKRAQMCRLEDQRGTEINFELPEFLKRREAVQVSRSERCRSRGWWLCADWYGGVELGWLLVVNGMHIHHHLS